MRVVESQSCVDVCTLGTPDLAPRLYLSQTEGAHGHMIRILVQEPCYPENGGKKPSGYLGRKGCG